jgi:transposase
MTHRGRRSEGEANQSLRTFAWLNQFRRLRVRYEKRADLHEAFLSLGCALICWNALESRAREAMR